jgi:biotin carboxyl carrier protein
VSNGKGLLTRLRVKLTPQFVEDWIDAAGRRFRKTGQQLSDYNKDHAKLGGKVDEAPDLLWKAAKGAANTQLARAEADYAKAENDRIDAELKRRTMTAKARHEESDADRAEAEAGTAKIKEIQARIELFKQLKDIDVSVTLDNSMNLAVGPAPTTPALIASEILAEEEVEQIQGNVVEVVCPDMSFGQDVTEVTLTKWIASVGSRVEADEPIYEVSTPAVDSEIPSPVAGTIVELIATEGSAIIKGQLVATILTTEPAEKYIEPISRTVAQFLGSWRELEKQVNLLLQQRSDNQARHDGLLDAIGSLDVFSEEDLRTLKVLVTKRNEATHDVGDAGRIIHTDVILLKSFLNRLGPNS